MRWIKTLIVGVIALLVMLVGVLLTIHNTEKVSIDLVFVQLPEASLSLWLLAALFAGGVLGVALSVFTMTVMRARLGASRRRVALVQKELDRLRTSTMKEAR